MVIKIRQKEGNDNVRPQETVLFLELVLSTAGCQKHLSHDIYFQQCGMCDQQRLNQSAHMRSLIRAIAMRLNIL